MPDASLVDFRRQGFFLELKKKNNIDFNRSFVDFKRGFSEYGRSPLSLHCVAMFVCLYRLNMPHGPSPAFTPVTAPCQPGAIGTLGLDHSA